MLWKILLLLLVIAVIVLVIRWLRGEQLGGMD